MSGHSKWSKVKHFKGAVDSKRSKMFTKFVREITVAAKLGGPDPDGNPRLRLAINTAKANSMPKDTVDRAIKKATGEGDTTMYEEVVYEGYGPGKFAVIAECLTDNRNRTASVIRTIFNKGHATLGSSNSVQFLFERKGMIVVPKSTGDEEKVTELVIESGAEDLEDIGDGWLIKSTVEAFGPARAFIEGKGIDIKSAELSRIPTTIVALNDKDTAEKAINFVETLEDDDDVQNVYTNFEIPDAVLEKLQ